MKLKFALVGVLLTLGLAAPASAHAPFNYRAQSWDLLGTRVVNSRAERDIVPAFGHRPYREIKVCAYGRPIRFFDLDVRFQNGGRQDLAVRAVLNPGQCTRAIDLRGQRRDIRFVNMAYKTLGWHRGRAVVRVYAR